MTQHSRRELDLDDPLVQFQVHALGRSNEHDLLPLFKHDHWRVAVVGGNGHVTFQRHLLDNDVFGFGERFERKARRGCVRRGRRSSEIIFVWLRRFVYVRRDGLLDGRLVRRPAGVGRRVAWMFRARLGVVVT